MKRVTNNAMNMVGGKTQKFEESLYSYQKSKSRPKTKPNIKKIAVISLVSTLILAIGFVVFAICSDYFTLKRVKIDGMIRSNSFDILSKAFLEQEKNIFLISRDDIKNNIEEDKLIIVKSVSLEPPDMISITIEEREALALLEYNGRTFEVTADNYILKKENIYNYNLPYLRGFQLDPQSESIENDYTLYMIDMLANLYQNNVDVFNIISEIDCSGSDLLIYTRGYNTKVLTPHYVTTKKLVDLAAILMLLKVNGEQVIQIDFRFDNAVLKYK